ncbi:MAG TPA: hypothetical protein VGC41_04705, partial [Kofleriaceae bacterium]
MTKIDVGRVKKTLVLAGTKPKKISFEVRGSQLLQTTWTAKGEPKITVKKLANAAEAKTAYAKAVRRKLRDDYVMLAPPTPGKIMFEAFASGGGGGPILDLSPDGNFIVAARMTSESNFGVKLELVEVATGVRRVLVEHPGGVTQQFLHAALFTGDGKGIYYAIREDIEYVEILTGKRKAIAKASELNPFVVHPKLDAERRRLVVFAKHTVKVIDETRTTLCEVNTKHRTTECRGAAISASGRYLALYIVSRGI